MTDDGVGRRPLLILGVGNVLMGDEGVGVHAVRMMDPARLPAGADVLDGGTGGFQLLSVFREYGTIILIDATLDDRPPGTVTALQPRFAHDFPRSLSAHDIGLRDLLESAQLLGNLPAMHLFTVSIAFPRPFSTELSPHAAAVLPELVGRVEALARDITGSIPPVA